MSVPDRSVLIGFADALAAPEVAASLLAAGYRVTSFTRRGRPVALRRMRAVELVEVTAPEDDLVACLSQVRAAAARCDVTMPLTDAAVLVCDEALPAEAIVAGPRAGRARLALDKRLQLRAARAAGLCVPDWAQLAPGARPDPALGTPVVLKPALAIERHGNGLRRLSPRVVSDDAGTEQAWRRWGESTPVIAQRFARGTGAGVFGLAEAGDVHHLSAHRRVRMMNPAGSGSSACAAAPVPQPLAAPVTRLLGDAGWSGLFMVELLRCDDAWWFVELNGRAWGSLALARRLGYEYPAWAVARALDPAAPLPEAPPFREMLCRNLGRELVHLSYVLRGPRSPAQRWPGRRSTLRALARHPQGTTWYNRGPALDAVFLYDAWRTVADQTWARRR